MTKLHHSATYSILCKVVQQHLQAKNRMTGSDLINPLRNKSKCVLCVPLLVRHIFQLFFELCPEPGLSGIIHLGPNWWVASLRDEQARPKMTSGPLLSPVASRGTKFSRRSGEFVTQGLSRVDAVEVPLPYRYSASHRKWSDTELGLTDTGGRPPSSSRSVKSLSDETKAIFDHRINFESTDSGSDFRLRNGQFSCRSMDSTPYAIRLKLKLILRIGISRANCIVSFLKMGPAVTERLFKRYNRRECGAEISMESRLRS